MDECYFGSLPRYGTWLLCLLAGPTDRGAAAEDQAQARLERDQSQVFDRLSSLRTMMDRLAQKLENEGRTYKADLLRNAVEQLQSRDLEGRKHELLRMIREKDLQVVDRQADLESELVEIYRLLMDKTDLDQVTTRARGTSRCPAKS